MNSRHRSLTSHATTGLIVWSQDRGTSRSHQDPHASASYDIEGDALTFAWLAGGEVVGEGPRLTLDSDPWRMAQALRVTDATGRSTWAYPVAAGG